LDRPWQGESALPSSLPRPAYDPRCYLCPGNVRVNGRRNPRYDHTFVFDNDYSALEPDAAADPFNVEDLLIAHGEPGRCRVLCFSARHDLDIANMETAAVRAVIDAWAQEYVQLGQLPYVNAVTIFENRGAAMGASNPHPHGQIWANASVPNELHKETLAQAKYLERRHACLLCSYVTHEIADGTRVIHVDRHVCVIVPFWAIWPFEVLVVPRRHVGSIDALVPEERDALAEAVQGLCARYDRLFATPFPYSMGFHQRPTDGGVYEQWHAHAHYYPPLLRSASIRKYVVGYELLAQPQRDLTAEEAARRLREA
jgi:UDPglucose--hexose-1-phosphate uridylyltransferase